MPQMVVQRPLFRRQGLPRKRVFFRDANTPPRLVSFSKADIQKKITGIGNFIVKIYKNPGAIFPKFGEFS
jgi:hypothetical protein